MIEKVITYGTSTDPSVKVVETREVIGDEVVVHLQVWPRGAVGHITAAIEIRPPWWRRTWLRVLAWWAARVSS